MENRQSTNINTVVFWEKKDGERGVNFDGLSNENNDIVLKITKHISDDLFDTLYNSDLETVQAYIDEVIEPFAKELENILRNHKTFDENTNRGKLAKAV